MFEGFTPETIAFFAALRFNNNRAFFEENRQTYDEAVRAPLTALAEALAPTALDIDPQLDVRPARSVSRIYRDLRFRKDKTPYRDHMWVGFRRMGESRSETCGFYFDISDQSANWGCGFYYMQPDTMRHFREKLVKEPKRVLGIFNSPALSEGFEVMGDAYVRQHQPPEGMDPLLGTLYRKKCVYAEHHVEDMSLLFSAGLADQIAEGFRALAPLYTLLRECMIIKAEEVGR